MRRRLVDTPFQDTGEGEAATRNLRFASFNMGTGREFPFPAHSSTATMLELAQRTDILCLQETHLHEHQWADFLKQFRTATKAGGGVASHAPNALGQRSFTGVSIVFTQAILLDGLVVRPGRFLRDTEGRWVSVQIEWTGITVTLV